MSADRDKPVLSLLRQPIPEMLINPAPGDVKLLLASWEQQLEYVERVVRHLRTLCDLDQKVGQRFDVV